MSRAYMENKKGPIGVNYIEYMKYAQYLML